MNDQFTVISTHHGLILYQLLPIVSLPDSAAVIYSNDMELILFLVKKILEKYI